ncbi:MAG: cytochrome c [Gammaproteobacteria bacterium]
MRYTILTLATTFMAALATAPLHAADSGHGKTLHEQNCMGCHDDSVYTRKNRRVSSLQALQKQVRRCELSQGLQWFDDDVAAVTDYLNSSYYNFK